MLKASHKRFFRFQNVTHQYCELMLLISPNYISEKKNTFVICTYFNMVLKKKSVMYFFTIYIISARNFSSLLK